MLLVAIIYLIALASVVLAFRFGGRPERDGALVIICMSVAGLCQIFFFKTRFISVDIIALFDDLVGLIGFASIGIFTKRIWPLWAAAFQLLSVGAHFVRALTLPVRPIVYAWMKTGPTWAVLILLIVGTLANRRRNRKPA